MARPIAVLFAAAAAVVLCSVLALTLGSHRPDSPSLLSVKMIHGDIAVRASRYATREQNAVGSSQATNSTMLSCGNGLTCAAGQTCTSTLQGAGARNVCSPHANAVICNDTRFSCPAGSTCQAEQCTPSNGGASVNASTAFNAVSIERRTYGNGVHISPNDPPGTAKDLGSDICNALAPSLPGLCSCGSIRQYLPGGPTNSTAAEVYCPISFIHDYFSTLEVIALFVPCTSGGPRIHYEYSIGDESVNKQNVVPQVFPAGPINPSLTHTFNQWLNIPGCSTNLVGMPAPYYYLTAGFSGTVNLINKTIAASLSVDVCGTAVNPGTGQISGCASQYPTRFKTELGATSACPDHPSTRDTFVCLFSVTTCPFPFASACTSHVAFINSCLNRVPQTRPLSCFFGRLLRLRPHLRPELSFPKKLERQWRLRVTCRHHLSRPTARILGAAAGIDACGPSPDVGGNADCSGLGDVDLRRLTVLPLSVVILVRGKCNKVIVIRVTPSLRQHSSKHTYIICAWGVIWD